MLAVRKDISEEIKANYATELRDMDLEETVREFFTYLDYTEESDNGVTFHPLSFSSCRVLMTEPFNMVLSRLRFLTNKGGSR